jgi:hypothetical protein
MTEEASPTKRRLPIVISIAGLIISIGSVCLATWFALQQRALSRRVNEAIISEDTSYNDVVEFWPNNEDGPTYRCAQVVRLYNAGGADGSLVSFDVVVRYKGKELRYHSATAKSRETLPEVSHPADENLQHFFTQVVSPEERQPIATDAVYYSQLAAFLGYNRLVSFPVAIPSKEVTSLRLETFVTDAGLTATGGGWTQSGYIEEASAKPGSTPIEIDFTFQFAEGRPAHANNLMCFHR